MYEVVGFSRSQFQAQDNQQMISGYMIYLKYEDKNTTGFRFERIFLSDGKCTYVPNLGDVVNVSYNRYGKVQSVSLI